MPRSTPVCNVAVAAITLTLPVTPLAQTTRPAGQAPSDSAHAWYLQALEWQTRDGGRWITPNNWRSAEEPWMSYVLEWKKGISGRTVQGRLLGIDEQGREQTFWEYYLYWDAMKHRAVVLQVNGAGGFGSGEIAWTSGTEHSLDQEFVWPDGSRTRMRHVDRRVGEDRHVGTFTWENGQWQPQRTYIWKRQRPTQTQQDFLDRSAFLLRDGGKWSAPNPDHDPANEWSPSEFGYQYAEGYGPGQLRLKITGKVGDKNYLYWEGFYYWHPTRQRTVYQALGTSGGAAGGETSGPDGSLEFDLVMPDGTVERHRDREAFVSETEMRSSSFKDVRGAWEPIRTMNWRRVRPEG